MRTVEDCGGGVVVVVFNSRGGVLRGNSRGIKTPVAYYPVNLPSCPITTFARPIFQGRVQPRSYNSVKALCFAKTKKSGGSSDSQPFFLGNFQESLSDCESCFEFQRSLFRTSNKTIWEFHLGCHG